MAQQQKIYVGQTALRLTGSCYINLASATAKLKYKKPNGQEGEWSAIISDAANGIIYHDVQAGELDVSGWWTVWGFATLASGGTIPGHEYKIYVYEEGEE